MDSSINRAWQRIIRQSDTPATINRKNSRAILAHLWDAQNFQFFSGDTGANRLEELKEMIRENRLTVPDEWSNLPSRPDNEILPAVIRESWLNWFAAMGTMCESNRNSKRTAKTKENKTYPLQSAITDPSSVRIRRFLVEFPKRGLASSIVFRPHGASFKNLESFCIPARAITEDEWCDLSDERPGGVDPTNADPTDRIARGAVGVLFNSWLQRDHRRVVVKGEPGEGKTTALWLLAAELCRSADQFLDEGNAISKIPLLLPLKEISDHCNSTSLLEYAITHSLNIAGLPEEETVVMRHWLVSKAKHGGVVLLLDALDELPSARVNWLRSQLDDMVDIAIVLTTRYHADPSLVLSQYKLLRLVPLRWWLIDSFITRYFEGFPRGVFRANELRALLRQTPSLRKLMRNPFLLTVMCHLRADDENVDLPVTRSALLRATLHALLKRKRDQATFPTVKSISADQKVLILGEVALQFQREQPKPMPEAKLFSVLDHAIKKNTRYEQPLASALLDEFVASGILVRRGLGPYNFILRLFHEYCLALHLAQEIAATPNFANRLRGRAHLWGYQRQWGSIKPINQPGWAEIWPLLAGCLGAIPVVVEIFEEEWRNSEDLNYSRLRILALVLGEFLESNHRDQIAIDKWEPLAKEVGDAVLDLCRSEISVTGLFGSWRVVMAHLPTAISTAKVTDRLVKKTTALSEKHTYILTLGEIGTPDASAWLRRVIEDQSADEVLRANAAVALGLVGDELSRDLLLKWLHQSYPGNRYLHFGCVSGLAHVADAKSRTALASLLSTHETDEEARLQCIGACGLLFGPDIERELLSLAERNAALLIKKNSPQQVNRINEVIDKCAEVLGRIGGVETAKSLAKLSKLPVALNVRRTICEAVAATGDQSGREDLQKWTMMPRDGTSIEQYAALALVKVGDAKFLDPLLEVASSNQCPEHMREEVVCACFNSRSAAVLAFLEKRLKEDPAEAVKRAAVKALGRIGGSFAVEALKQALKKPKLVAVHFECALALAALRDADGEHLLLGYLSSNKTDTIRSAQLRQGAATFGRPAVRLAVDALSHLDSTTSRDALRSMALNPNEPEQIRRCSLDALSRIQREQGWRALVRGGWDAP